MTTSVMFNLAYALRSRYRQLITIEQRDCYAHVGGKSIDEHETRGKIPFHRFQRQMLMVTIHLAVGNVSTGSLFCAPATWSENSHNQDVARQAA